MGEGCFSRTLKIIFILSAIGFGLYAIIYSLSRNSDSWKTDYNVAGAYVQMEDYVKQRLKSPSTAKFANVLSANIEQLENQTYKIDSYVDSQNGFGAIIRTRYIGEVQQISEDEWQLISLDFYPY